MNSSANKIKIKKFIISSSYELSMYVHDVPDVYEKQFSILLFPNKDLLQMNSSANKIKIKKFIISFSCELSMYVYEVSDVYEKQFLLCFSPIKTCCK